MIYVIMESQVENRVLLPWIEKYRPKNVEDLLVDGYTMSKVNKIIENKTMENMIITGPPGVGKTTTLLCIARYLLGKYFSEGVLEMNASDERGIKTVQGPIINFCKKKMDLDNSTYSKHKLILLDEADNMPKKTQQLVSNLMDKYNDTTRFAFTCNNSVDIIDAIQSRCIIIRYKRLSSNKIIQRLSQICDKEGVKWTLEGLDAILVVANGDMRQAINNLQTISAGYSNINEDNVFKVCDKPHPIIIKRIFVACMNHNIKNALLDLRILRQTGYSSLDIIINMINLLKSQSFTELNEKYKIAFMEELGNTLVMISNGITSELTVTGCVCKLSQLCV